MNWREWAIAKIKGDVGLQALVDDRVFSTVEGSPDTPFVVVRFAPGIPAGVGGEIQDLVVWVHDQPQSYTRIDEILPLIRAALEGPIEQAGESGIMVDWDGDSGDLADDARGTVLRNSSYRLVGRRSA
jgi:hypothetical protein